MSRSGMENEEKVDDRKIAAVIADVSIISDVSVKLFGQLFWVPVEKLFSETHFTIFNKSLY